MVDVNISLTFDALALFQGEITDKDIRNAIRSKLDSEYGCYRDLLCAVRDALAKRFDSDTTSSLIQKFEGLDLDYVVNDICFNRKDSKIDTNDEVLDFGTVSVVLTYSFAYEHALGVGYN